LTASDSVYIGVFVFALALGLLIIGFVSVTLTSHLQNTTTFQNDTYASAALGGTSYVTDKLDYLVLVVFIGMIIALIVTSWYIGASPVFIFVYFLVIVMGIVVGAILSNVWESVSTTAPLSMMLSSLPITGHIITYLPMYMAVVGFIGMVVMFAKPYGSSNEGSGVLR
jgi:hypothetical protein